MTKPTDAMIEAGQRAYADWQHSQRDANSMFEGIYTAMESARDPDELREALEDGEQRFAELRHWFFQKLNPEQRMGFLFASGIAPKTCDFTLGMQHQAIKLIAERLTALSRNRGDVGHG
jgi:hypothetical protein